MLKGSFFGMYLLSLGVILKTAKNSRGWQSLLLPILSYFYVYVFINKPLHTPVSVNAINFY